MEGIAMSNVLDHLHIVLCQEHYNPLGIIRSLGEAGISPIAIIVKNSRKQYVGSSKYICRSMYADDITEAISILKKEYSNESNKPFVYITDDYFLEYIDNHYDEFKDLFIFPNAGGNGKISYYMNKDHLNQLARECGISVPNSVVLPKGELPKCLKYPIITKAISSTSGAWKEDSFICNTEAELIEAYSIIKGETMLLQEYIDRAGEFNIDALSVNHGKSVFLSMLTDFVYLVPGRYSTYLNVKNVDDNDLAQKIRKMIEKIGFEGVFDGEFMIGKDGTTYFLEINFRPNAFNHASTDAGMNCPYLWAKGMLEGEVSEQNYRQIPKGFRYMVENTDFKDRVISKRTNIFKWFWDFVRCESHAFFNIRDIKPFIRAFFI